MIRESGDVRKLDSSSPLEGSVVGVGRAEAELQSKSADPTREARGWLWVLIRLAPMMAVGLIPFVVLWLTSKNDLRHYISPDLLAVLVGGWAIFAIWVTLDKGMDGLLAREPAEIAWSLIGLSNLVGVLLFFVHLCE
jgi:hypothetical protein